MHNYIYSLISCLTNVGLYRLQMNIYQPESEHTVLINNVIYIYIYVCMYIYIGLTVYVCKQSTISNQNYDVYFQFVF